MVKVNDLLMYVLKKEGRGSVPAMKAIKHYHLISTPQ